MIIINISKKKNKIYLNSKIIILIITTKLKIYLKTHFYNQQTILNTTYIKKKYIYNKYTINPNLLKYIPIYYKHTKPSLYIFNKNYKFKKLKHFFYSNFF